MLPALQKLCRPIEFVGTEEAGGCLCLLTGNDGTRLLQASDNRNDWFSLSHVVVIFGKVTKKSQIVCKSFLYFYYFRKTRVLTPGGFEQIEHVLNKLENAKNDLNKGKNGKTI